MNIENTVDIARAELAWLAGFWDADGSIGIKKQSKYLAPFATCTNTSEKAILKICELLDLAEVPYHIELQDRSHLNNSKDCWIVRMNSKARVKKFLHLIKDYLVVKKEQAELTLLWCDLKKTDGPNGLPDEYWSIRDKVQELNARGRPQTET